jgi:hypothetical protein
MSKEKLIARSKELQIEVPEGATNKEISNLIMIAEHPLISKGLQTTQDELDGQKELTATAVKERDAESEKLKTANETIQALNSKLEAANALPQKTKGETYKSENGTFEFGVKKFRFKGEKYIASEAVKNEELMEELIEAKFNHLKQV